MSPLLSAQFWSQAAWPALCVTHLELQSDPVMAVALPVSSAYSEIAETRTATSNQAIRFIFPPQRELHRARGLRTQRHQKVAKPQHISRDFLFDFEIGKDSTPVLPSCTLVEPLFHLGRPQKVCDPHQHGRDNPDSSPCFPTEQSRSRPSLPFKKTVLRRTAIIRNRPCEVRLFRA